VSKIDAIKAYVLNYIHHFSMYDYAAYSWLILIFFVTILLAIMIAKKSAIFSILILMISLALLFQVTLVKKLTFSDSLIINGLITNISKKRFSTCNINISVVKSSQSDIQEFINQLKPLLKRSISIDKPIEVNTTKEFRVVFNNYTYSKKINISINSECY